MAVETTLSTGAALDMRSLAPARTSFVCLLAPPGRTGTQVIYTEYPFLTRAWVRVSRQYHDVEIITTHGSTEGLARVDDRAAGVVLVTSAGLRGQTTSRSASRSWRPTSASSLPAAATC